MNFKKLGNTDLKVSTICLGTMTWGEQNNKKEAFEQMNYALNSGVNFFDVAEIYPSPCKEETYGETERIVGNWFNQNKNRNKIILASKIAGPGLPWVRNGGQNFSEQKIYERSRDHELGVGEAFFLGLKDTYRGVKQMAGVDLDNMERDQQRIRNLLEDGDGLAKAAYFGGLILDPAMWLIPVLRGKGLYTLAKNGAIAGGLSGAFGYVDDQSFFEPADDKVYRHPTFYELPDGIKNM